MDMMLHDYQAACKIAGRLLSDVELKIILDLHHNSPNLQPSRLLEAAKFKTVSPSNKSKAGKLGEAEAFAFKGLWVLEQIIEDLFGIKKSTIKNYRKIWTEGVHWKIGKVGKCHYCVDAINEFMQE